MPIPPAVAEPGPPPVADPAPPRTLAPDPMQDACQPMLSLVGQPESVLTVMDFAQDTRIYRTGDPITMDFSPERMNIEIGPDGIIVKVSCG